MSAVITIPDIASCVPMSMCALENGDTNNNPVSVMLSERQALGLPFVLPNDTHESLQDCVIDNLKLVGYQPNAFSEKYIGISLGLDREDPYYGGSSYDPNSYTLHPEPQQINLFDELSAMETFQVGLGETVMYWLKTNSWLYATGTDCYQFYLDYRTEGSEDDEEAKEFLLQEFGYDEDGIEQWLPSAVFESLGGRTFTLPEQKLSVSEFNDTLQRFTPHGARLHELLTQVLPQCIESIKNTVSNFHTAFYLEPLIIGYFDRKKVLAIQDLIDQEMQDAMNNGEEKLIEIERFTHKNGSAADGLVLVANLLNTYTALDEIITLIQGA